MKVLLWRTPILVFQAQRARYLLATHSQTEQLKETNARYVHLQNHASLLSTKCDLCENDDVLLTDYLLVQTTSRLHSRTTCKQIGTDVMKTNSGPYCVLRTTQFPNNPRNAVHERCKTMLVTRRAQIAWPILDIVVTAIRGNSW